MRKTIFQFWLINFIACIVLYIAYRVFIASDDSKEKDLGPILYIFDILLNLGFALIYLVAMAFCSLTIFLNSIPGIRHNRLLSLLTFSGPPAAVVAVLTVRVIQDYSTSGGSIINTLWLFSIAYLLFTLITFLLFSTRVKRDAELPGTDRTRNIN